jgi:DNA-binding CsgD family transcriptional regulator
MSAAAMERLRALAEDPGGGWLAAGAARGAALLAEGYDAGAFYRAIRVAERLGVPLEVARTQLLQGGRARSSGHPSAAREPLRAALAGFERLGAERWAERARTQLRNLGAAVAPSAEEQSLAVLNEQELQIARLVSRGMTNREAAAALFLSPKTIEYHLRAIYRKLEIRSRTQLAAIMTRELAGAT